MEHCCFHITHRCQERRFLLKFEIDRRNYVKRLRESLWSECVAVGDEDWILALAGRVRGMRHEVVRYEFPDELGETKVSYGLKVSQRSHRSLAAYLAS